MFVCRSMVETQQLTVYKCIGLSNLENKRQQMHNPESRLKKTVILILYLLASIPVSGSDNNIDGASRNCYGYRIYTGNLDNRTADVQQGIYDYLPKLLDKFSITESEYISITTTTVSE